MGYKVHQSLSNEKRNDNIIEGDGKEEEKKAKAKAEQPTHTDRGTNEPLKMFDSK